MKRFYTMIIMLISTLTLSFGQSKVREKLAYGAEITQSLTNTKYTQANLFVGFNSDSTKQQILFGPLYRKLHGGVGHNSDYFGGSIYSEANIVKKLSLFLQIDFVYGSWFKQDKVTLQISKHKNMEPMPTFGLGYKINNININLGYNYFVYDPQDYVHNGVSAFQNHGATLSLKYAILKN